MIGCSDFLGFVFTCRRLWPVNGARWDVWLSVGLLVFGLFASNCCGLKLQALLPPVTKVEVPMNKIQNRVLFGVIALCNSASGLSLSLLSHLLLTRADDSVF